MKRKRTEKALLSLANLSPFSIFRIRKSTDIDREKLDKKYAKLISEMHPDRFINYTLDRKIAEENTSLINQSYQILTTPKLLYEYLLSLHKSSEAELIDVDMSDIMSLYNEMNAVDTAKDATFFKEKIERLYNITLHNIRKSIVDKNFDQGTRHMQRLNFLEKLFKEARLKEFELSQNYMITTQ